MSCVCIRKVYYASSTPILISRVTNLVFVVWGRIVWLVAKELYTPHISLCTWLHINYITVFGLCAYIHICMCLYMCVLWVSNNGVAMPQLHNWAHEDICMHRNGLASPTSNKTACLKFGVTELFQVLPWFSSWVSLVHKANGISEI